MRTLIATVLTMLFSNGFAQTPAAKQPGATDSALLHSPRHQEWVGVKSGDRVVQAFVVYPEIDHKAESILVIHENRGLSDWVRSVADRLAAEGYIAIAPDLLSGMGPNGGKTSDFSGTDAVTEAIYKLDSDQVTADLKAVADYVRKLPAANGKLAVGGFCWGGSQTFRFATNYPGLEAAFVFYGTAPGDGLDRITAPVYGFYGGNDARVGATVIPTVEKMKELKKVYEPVTYDSAGHGFMRLGEAADATEGNANAMREGWERWLKLIGNR